MLQGVRGSPRPPVTHSMVMRSKVVDRAYIEAHHRFEQ